MYRIIYRNLANQLVKYNTPNRWDYLAELYRLRQLKVRIIRLIKPEKRKHSLELTN